jgi:hypothetical protein
MNLIVDGRGVDGSELNPIESNRIKVEQTESRLVKVNGPIKFIGQRQGEGGPSELRLVTQNYGK